jgi:two-component system, cell cycle response regulator
MAAADRRDSQRDRVPNEPQKSTGSGKPRPRVLVADDSRIVRASIVQHLKDRFDIREVTDGEAAWQAILLDSSIRVVISDLTMPKVDGFELLNRVRSSKVQRIRELPIVIISGEDESAERERAAGMGASDFIRKGVGAAELLARMEVLVRLSTTREALAESQASLESSRTVDSDTELLNTPFFDKQVEKLISFARRALSDVAVICVRVELSTPKNETWDGETDQRIKLVGRALAASIRLEDLGTRTDRFEFCVATPSSGLSGVLRFAARLRKVLENVEAAGPGVEVWTCIGLATLSEELRRSAEELRALAQKRVVRRRRDQPLPQRGGPASRHARRPPALIYLSSETGEEKQYTYAELHREVNRCAAVCKAWAWRRASGW